MANPSMRRIGDAENPYVVAPREEDYAGPMSLFPTAGRLIGDAENPYAVSPEIGHSMERTIGQDRSNRSMWRDAPPLIEEGESKNIEDRRSTQQGSSYTYRAYPQEKPSSVKELTVPDRSEMEDRIDHEKAGAAATRTLDEYLKFSKERRSRQGGPPLRRQP